jgi:hypothetical protein
MKMQLLLGVIFNYPPIYRVPPDSESINHRLRLEVLVVRFWYATASLQKVHHCLNCQDLLESTRLVIRLSHPFCGWWLAGELWEASRNNNSHAVRLCSAMDSERNCPQSTHQRPGGAVIGQ